jgi:LmbE family N-acetylglucosaminyl deacetylase
MQVVILAPHGDDEVLGFGGTISKYNRNGHSVHVCFIKAPYTSRTHQQRNNTKDSAVCLGFNAIYLDVPPDELCNFNSKTLDKIEKELSNLGPDILYIPCKTDTHQDHEMIYKYAKIATRINGPNPVGKVLCGEIISSTESGIGHNFRPQYYNKLSEQDLILKKQAMQCYKQEARPYPHPRSPEGIELHAKKRGMEAGTTYAEAFECLRYIV